jgi:predicted DNA-binding protein with PD1-like motif
MKFTSDGFNFVLRLDMGEQVVDSIKKFVKDNNIKSGFITGIGGLTWAELGFYDMTAKAYVWSRFEEALELLNVTGSIAWMNKEPILHLHATVSDASQYARGGHLNEASVSGTVEIFIHVLDEDKVLKRYKDKKTGLNLLDL